MATMPADFQFSYLHTITRISFLVPRSTGRPVPEVISRHTNSQLMSIALLDFTGRRHMDGELYFT